MPTKRSPLQRPVRPSMVDGLAQQLSERTGSEFEVLRRRETYSSNDFRDSVVTRYFLRATHGGRRDGQSYTHVFGGYRGFTANEMKYYLASILDMISMEYIPVSRVVAFMRKQRS